MSPHWLFLDIDHPTEDAEARQSVGQPPSPTPHPNDLHYSTFGPRALWSGGTRQSVDWPAVDQAIATMVDRLSAAPKEPELHVHGLMPLPAAFSLGFRLGSWRRLKLLGRHGPTGPWYHVDPNEGTETTYFGPPRWDGGPSNGKGTVILHVSTMGRPLVPDSLHALLSGKTPLAVAELLTSTPLEARHGKAAQQELLSFVREALKRYPRHDRLLMTIDGPTPLAVMAGRAWNPNLVRLLEVPDFRGGSYVAAWRWPPGE